MELIKDKVVIVTGAAAGIGAGVAKLFAEHGARVVIAERDEPSGQAAAERIEQAGIDVVIAGPDPALIRGTENGRTRVADIRRPA